MRSWFSLSENRREVSGAAVLRSCGAAVTQAINPKSETLNTKVVYLVCLVYLVYFVCLVNQINQMDKRNQINQKGFGHLIISALYLLRV
jgi:uncharacterized membrane protein